MNRNVTFLLMLLALLLPACSAAIPEIASDMTTALPATRVVFVTAEPPTATATSTPLPSTPAPSPTATERESSTIVEVTETPVPQPEPITTDTPTPKPSPTPEPDWLNNYGRTTDNLVYLGNPAAPVSLIDFSDFM